MVLTHIAIVIAAALAGGLLFARIKQPPILGYILMGVLLGPPLFAFIESREQIDMLAELGVLLLLFGVGMELNLRLLRRVWPIACLCVLLQTVGCVGISSLLGWFFNWSIGMTVLIGFVATISSTAIVFKTLDSIGELKTETGQLTISILIIQDLAVVPMILILRHLQESAGIFQMILGKVFLSAGLLIALIAYLNRHKRVHLPITALISGEKELTPVASLTFCFGAAAISGLMGLPAAYGAFLAGLVLGNTHERLILLETTKPIQNLLSMVFFLSIGLLLDLKFLWEHLGTILLCLLIITISKTTINIFILHVLKLHWAQAFLVGLVFAQLGEFAFLLATVGKSLQIMDGFAYKLIVSLTVLSLLLTPIWLVYTQRLKYHTGRYWVNLRSVVDLTRGGHIQWIKRCWRVITGKTGFFAKSPPPHDDQHDA